MNDCQSEMQSKTVSQSRGGHRSPPTRLAKRRLMWLGRSPSSRGREVLGAHVSVLPVLMSYNACLSGGLKVLKFGSVCNHKPVCTTQCQRQPSAWPRRVDGGGWEETMDERKNRGRIGCGSAIPQGSSLREATRYPKCQSYNTYPSTDQRPLPPKWANCLGHIQCLLWNWLAGGCPLD